MINLKTLIVAGGGGGGGGGSTYANGGGGGGGGVIAIDSLYLDPGSYPIVVGKGSSGGTAYMSATANGKNSSFAGNTARGGKGAAGWSGSPPSGTGGSGAGGAGYSQNSSTGTPGTQKQGNAGGNGVNTPDSTGNGGGGGGAGSAGSNCSGTSGGNGGSGISSTISGTLKYYGGGGGGGGGVTGGIGGSGIGGNGGSGNTNGFDAVANTGSGGGGCGASDSGGGTSGGKGSDGVVIISYETSKFTGTGGTVTTNGIYTVHTFTKSETFTITEILKNYHLNGTAILGPIVLPLFTKNPTSNIDWTESFPDGTSILLSTAIKNSVPEENDYKITSKQGPIPELDSAASGKNLYIKILLVTKDASKTPSLSNLTIEITGAEDDKKIIIGLSNGGRLKCPIGDVVVAYNESLGNLTGMRGGQVESFAVSFIPSNLSRVFNPNAIEHISALLSFSSESVHIDYIYTKSSDEHLTAQLSATSLIINVEDINT